MGSGPRVHTRAVLTHPLPSSITFAGGPGRDGTIDFTPGSELLITKAKNGHLAVVSGAWQAAPHFPADSPRARAEPLVAKASSAEPGHLTHGSQSRGYHTTPFIPLPTEGRREGPFEPLQDRVIKLAAWGGGEDLRDLGECW